MHFGQGKTTTVTTKPRLLSLDKICSLGFTLHEAIVASMLYYEFFKSPNSPPEPIYFNSDTIFKSITRLSEKILEIRKV